MDRLFFSLGAGLAGVAVALGAFGAHALKARLDAAMLTNFETGARYQMYHALALFAVAWAVDLLAGLRPAGDRGLAVCWPASACSPAVCTSWPSRASAWLGAVTPLGGAAFLAGWLCLIIAAWRARPNALLELQHAH